MTAIPDIRQERVRQIEEEGWTEEHDDEHSAGELARAAAAYASPEPVFICRRHENGMSFIDPFPWPGRYDGRKRHDRRRQLVIAGALIAAEVERFDRKEGPVDRVSILEEAGEVQAERVAGGQTDAVDDTRRLGELALASAAITCTHPLYVYRYSHTTETHSHCQAYPWLSEWRILREQGRREQLLYGAALVICEIERIDRGGAA